MTSVEKRVPNEIAIGLGAESLSVDQAKNLANNTERQQLIDLMLSATSRDEILEARRAQAAWLAAHPNDFGVLEAGETLSYAEAELLGEEIPNGPLASTRHS